MQPATLDLSDDGTALHVEWPDTGTDIIAAATLRAAARDAASTRQRIDFGSVRVAPDLRIVSYDLVGAMGLNLHFSDGHDRAIYPWVYLREIASGNVN